MVVFAHYNLDLNAFVVFVLAGIDVFFYLTEEFSLLICSHTRSWMKRVMLPIYCSLHLLHLGWYTLFFQFVGIIRCKTDGAFVSGRFALRGGVR